MDLRNLHSISNDYQSVRLISLKDWRSAREFEDRDQGGPYMVAQTGYDPDDLRMEVDEFVLGKSGAWITIGVFLKLPRDLRRQEFVFGRAAEIISLLDSLPGKAQVITTPQEAAAAGTAPEEDPEDDLSGALMAAKAAWH